ncbi:site-specific DNA-methyltransferase [Candidatus Parcubacteria bacterium]|nr:MAG: site-specific DNA-methyltransferase [Candidatus Parcubacteria bacterium]
MESLNIERLPEHLKKQLEALYLGVTYRDNSRQYLSVDQVHHGDARVLLPEIKPNSIALSVWSPPYFVGKSYEANLSFIDWQNLLKEVISLHFPIIKPGGFLVINIADILTFKDETMPRIQAEVVSRRRTSITREQILKVWAEHPEYNRHQIAKLLGCSEQTIDRRLNGNNIRGGKQEIQTRVKLVGGMLEEWALEAGFYPYDRRIWQKDPAWQNSRWTSISYRSVDEFEYLYFFWKPGITKVDRKRLNDKEWKEWGSRAIWQIPSVRANDDHEAKFPVELPTRVIRLLTEPNDIVLDCFMGSGTTAVAAIQNGRRFIGIELLEDYVDLANSKIENELKKIQNVHNT